LLGNTYILPFSALSSHALLDKPI